MNITDFGTCTREMIHELEREIKFKLPDNYINFLLKKNGIKITDGTIFVNDLNQDVLLHILFGIKLSSTLDLYYWIKEYRGEIPEKSLIIGKDQGGGLFLLYAKNDVDSGVYFWDHSFFFSQSDESNNLYFVSDSFSNFIGSIKSIK